MDGMSDLLFCRTSGTLSVIVVSLNVLSVAVMCAALALLGRRNQLGWWLVAAGFICASAAALINNVSSAGGSTVVLALTLISLVITLVLTAGVGVYGLLMFQKFPPANSMIRDFTLRRFATSDLLFPLLVAILYTGVSLLATLSIFLRFSASTPPVGVLGILALNGFLFGLLPAGLLGLAQRSRWGWFLIAAASLTGIVGTTLSAGGSVLIFLFLAQGLLALYGWGRWGSIPKSS
ncbi:hypothetical protein [Arthrobacter psychrochitiniphilus]|uniref:Uncharacterized protein n=1 Tax=Arthrobacter psychrochitiniphilus TaxID=291045 RepID=A0A2V3DSG5_9MICC|nr:hypothetical protein [Arthrobacter psychrochitiniphilus]NYG18907.1 hypothetical protein [Arthrobacter psychrochitiniphilus]PXA66193.1 hypothetical protein CVS29_05665 [Arthrobacter psychrochitiniphilus]